MQVQLYVQVQVQEQVPIKIQILVLIQRNDKLCFEYMLFPCQPNPNYKLLVHISLLFYQLGYQIFNSSKQLITFRFQPHIIISFGNCCTHKTLSYFLGLGKCLIHGKSW